METVLPNRGVIALSGPDRAPFLQGLISNDILKVSNSEAIYSCLLTAQGRFLHDFFIIADDERFLIDCEHERRGDLIKRLSMFRLRSKVEIQDVSGDYKVAVYWEGGMAPTGITFADPRHPDLGTRALLSPDTDAVDNFTTYDRLRITLGAPDGSRDMEIDKALLLENNIDELHGIAWDKGCYMGQELTARMRYRALVKKRLTPVRIEGAAPAVGTVLSVDGKEVGEMRSSCGDVGLALLRVEKMQAKIPVNETVLCL